MARLAAVAATLAIWAAFGVCAAARDEAPLVAVEEKADCLVFQTQWYRSELDRATGLLRSVKPVWSPEDEAAMLPGRVEDAAGARHTPANPQIALPHRSPFYCMASCAMTTELGKHTRIYEFLDSPAIYVTDTTHVKNGTYYILAAAGEGKIEKHLDFRLLTPPFESQLILASDYLEVNVNNP